MLRALGWPSRCYQQRESRAIASRLTDKTNVVSLLTTPLAVKSIVLRACGKVSLFPEREAAPFSAPHAARLSGPADPPTRVRTDHEDDRMRTAFAPTGRDALPAKPQGGYRMIAAAVLATAWWAYRQKLIRLVDLRVWFAAHEMDARRCRLEQASPRSFNLIELRKITGLSLRRLGASLRRLHAARLLTWSESALDFPHSPHDPRLDFNQAGFQAYINRIPNPDRKVPVPRRTLRLLAGGARPALIATALGHLIHGLYLKSGKCLDRGRVKASWIADTFGVSLRRVKHARHELIASGWLIPLDADQWALNRWGAHFRINLDWSRLDTPASPVDPPIPDQTSPVASSKSAPPPAPVDPQSAPPESHKEPLNGRKKNQKPASGPAGISISHLAENAPKPRTAPSFPPPAPSAGKPNLRDVVLEDLKNTPRLLDLYNQAIVVGCVTTSERDRLRFVAAAEHARAIGTKNPCGLFVRLIRRGLWSFLTQDDEDAANARLKRHLHGLIPQAPPSKIPPARAAVNLSDDALLVRVIRAAVAGARYRGDAFPFLKRENPEWTRERWDRASIELEPPALLRLDLA